MLILKTKNLSAFQKATAYSGAVFLVGIFYTDGVPGLPVPKELPAPRVCQGYPNAAEAIKDSAKSHFVPGEVSSVKYMNYYVPCPVLVVM